MNVKHQITNIEKIVEKLIARNSPKRVLKSVNNDHPQIINITAIAQIITTRIDSSDILFSPLHLIIQL